MNPINQLRAALTPASALTTGTITAVKPNAIEIATPTGLIIHPTDPSTPTTYRPGNQVTLTAGHPLTTHQARTAPQTHWL